MNTKAIALCILIFGGLLIFGINEYKKETLEKQQEIDKLENEKQILLDELNKQKYKEEIVKTGCDLLNNSGERDICLRNEPYEKWDCTKFADFSFTIVCYQTLAKVNKDPQYCIKLKNDYDRDICYMGIANEANRPEICMGIIFPDIRKDCYGKINLKGFDPDICNSGWTLDERHQCRELIMEANE
jgi:hypothetical protein